MLRVTWREGTYAAVTTRSTSRVRRLSSSAIMASLHSVNATVRAIVVAFTRHCGCPEFCCRRCPLNDRELPRANGYCPPRLALRKSFYIILCNYTKFMLRRDSCINTRSSKGYSPTRSNNSSWNIPASAGQAFGASDARLPTVAPSPPRGNDPHERLRLGRSPKRGNRSFAVHLPGVRH